MVKPVKSNDRPDVIPAFGVGFRARQGHPGAGDGMSRTLRDGYRLLVSVGVGVGVGFKLTRMQGTEFKLDTPSSDYGSS
jgi:hypothetical protein